MNKKYELTDESIIYNGKKLYRIKALKDFSNVEKGELGGYIESEYNLSQENNCWVYNDAKVYDYARISGNAKVYGNVFVSGYTKIFGNAKVYGYAKVYGHALVSDNAAISGNAEIFDYAQIYGYAEIYNHAKVYDYTEVYGNAKICDNAVINNSYKIIGKVTNKFDDIIEIQNPKGRLVTAILRNGKIFYNVGCQDEITEEVFKDRIENENGGLENNPHREYYYRIIDMVNCYFEYNSRRL